jgi:hypothetical protein
MENNHAGNGVKPDNELIEFTYRGIDTAARLEWFYSRLGDAVLLPIPKGQKGPIFDAWQQITFKETQKETGKECDWSNINYALWRGGNLGVRLGHLSGGLCTIDADTDEILEWILENNPKLRKTLRTKGNRGAQLWIKPNGQYPQKVYKLRSQDKTDLKLEWRGDGQSVVFGEHPDTHKPYQILVNARPLETAFNEIKWPENAVLPWAKGKDSRIETNSAKSAGEHNINWFSRYRGDLETLDLVGVLEELHCEVYSRDGDCIYVECPGKEQHTNNNAETDFRVWIESGKFPSINCFHTSCGMSDLRAVCEWAESRSPGIIDRYCKEKFKPSLQREVEREQGQSPNGKHQKQANEPRQLDGVNILAFANLPIDEKATLLGNRYLCRRGGMFIVAPSGQGRSTLSIQLAVEWALERKPLGIQANGKLRVLIIQAEDDNGDVTEMSNWILKSGFSEEQLSTIERNTHIELVDDCTGKDFTKALEEICELWKPDIVIANPYESYLGADPRETDETNRFLRHVISPVIKKHKCGWIFMHHTPKTQFNKTEDFTTSDFMYRGSGCAAMSNWARAYMVFEPVNDEGLFRFVAAKRGQRIGWPKLYRYFRHSRVPGLLKWEEADDEGQAVEDLRTAKKSGNTSKPIDFVKVLECIPDDPQDKNEVFANISETCKLSRDKTRHALTYLKSQGKIFERTIPNPKPGKKGSRGLAAWSKNPGT